MSNLHQNPYLYSLVSACFIFLQKAQLYSHHGIHLVFKEIYFVRLEPEACRISKETIEDITKPMLN